jgi:thioredoxin 1
LLVSNSKPDYIYINKFETEVIYFMGKEQKYIEVTDLDFQKEVIESEHTVVVDFSAEWCGPCKIMVPVLNDLAGELEGKVKVVKIDVDNNPVTTAKYGVRSLPTILILKKGQVIDKVIGAVQKKVLADKLVSEVV